MPCARGGANSVRPRVCDPDTQEYRPPYLGDSGWMVLDHRERYADKMDRDWRILLAPYMGFYHAHREPGPEEENG